MRNIMSSINWDVVKPSLWSAAGGMFVGALALSQVFGFISPSTAEKLAAQRSNEAVVAALAPGCAADFRALPDVKERMATLVANKGSYQARDAFPSELVTIPGHSYIDYDLVRACSSLLMKPQTT
ncbi:MAG: hypothetical protein AB7I42_12880 [Bradyrhizobium sp.]|uniref:hypothetical protein n=1 Tax=Bradyrhizobium sp. TaxID=376 RepID=UPI002A302C57|nr:hypothetical protein [Bradyrhizobium sp.]